MSKHTRFVHIFGSERSPCDQLPNYDEVISPLALGIVGIKEAELKGKANGENLYESRCVPTLFRENMKPFISTTDNSRLHFSRIEMK